LGQRAVKVISLGKMGFMPAYNKQMYFARKILDQIASKQSTPSENFLLLVEHDPVYTVGIRTRGYTSEDEERLKQTGAEFHRTNRGGLITFHGPGQLVAYPIINLKQFKPSMKWYVCQLEKALIKTLHEFQLQGRTTDQTGVWVGDRKIASIGLHGSRYVTTHGISLNCNTDLAWFEHIVPCGLEGVEMTSLSRERQEDLSPGDATQAFLRSFQDIFECDLEMQTSETDRAVDKTSDHNSGVD